MGCIDTECGAPWVCNTTLEQACGKAKSSGTVRCGTCVGALGNAMLAAANCTPARVDAFCSVPSPPPPPAPPAITFTCDAKTLRCEETRALNNAL